MSDYLAWRKRSPTPQFLHFLRSNRLDTDDDDEDLTQNLTPAIQATQSVSSTVAAASPVTQAPTVLTPIPVASSSTQGKLVLWSEMYSFLCFRYVVNHGNVCIVVVESTVPDPAKLAGAPAPSSGRRSPPPSAVAGSFSPERRVPGSPSKLKGQQTPGARQHLKQTPPQETTSGSQEQIVEKAKQVCWSSWVYSLNFWLMEIS